MINNKYDFLKYLIAHMSKDTYQFVDNDNKLLKVVDAYKQQEYLEDLQSDGLIQIYIGYIQVNPESILFIKNLYNI
ncbi:hypothetical protein WS9_009545 [Paraclostridium sordellii 8483]|uniref:hypothetical protein n=1 Tax=Paraclostridium sordellii TaxID=1505 RepID=UPI0002F853DA|nr:hypothetical protein [Paeniclostridium sordellii]TAN66813.1 hypothetical protein WS9_009545 [Paeniclostridium sordellii 8483]